MNAYSQSTDGLVDIRPKEILELGDGIPTGISDKEQRGRELLNQCRIAHGWVKGGSSIISAKYVDDWSVAPERLQAYNNWPYLKQELQHDFLSFRLGFSKVRLLNGPSKEEIWGIDDNIPYKIINGKIDEIDDPNMIPALVGKEYFIQLPYWTQKVPIASYVKDTVLQNKRCHLVYGTWKTLKANSEFDQYLYWINKETKLLEIVQYTVRVVDPKAAGFVVFDDFRKVNGVVIPFVHRLGYLPTPEGLIHEMRFESIILDPKTLSMDDIRQLH
ncbi:hypothetical protein GTQ34_09665 [Muricauda sp. JGD-17]|uniref:Uncharacterized protein n=1 Tax=Flagellimonas ochracea TaxID=2696472 RepID=A0A964WXJ0_9FLAO|nr:hypothetical protein [Allomuricauda ochracea]NAY92186.1 hypothetical protein [Allomuricauda ochracea]